MSAGEISRNLEMAIQVGRPVLMENVTEQLDAVYEPILQDKRVKVGNQWKIKFGENMIDYHSDFKFYLTTKMPNPHYTPEICVQVNLLCFMVTPSGLEENMLNRVFQVEEKNKEDQRQKNIRDFFENRKKLINTENEILKMLNDATGNILDDEVLIMTLEQSKADSYEIDQKIQRQEQDNVLLKKIRDFYTEAAKRSANLYFSVMMLADIEPMYQFSLEFYMKLYDISMEEAPKPHKDSDKLQRARNIKITFTEILFKYVIRSLLEKDKLLFSLLLCQ